MADKQKATELREMSISKIGCNGKDAIKQDKNVYMCRIGGEATTKKDKENRSGDLYSYLIGEFFAVDAKGDVFMSSKLYLPVGLMELIESMLVKADGRPVKFGYDIWSDLDTKSSVGYKYRAISVIKAVISDVTSTLLAEMEASKPQAEVAGVVETKSKK